MDEIQSATTAPETIRDRARAFAAQEVLPLLRGPRGFFALAAALAAFTLSELTGEGLVAPLTAALFAGLIALYGMSLGILLVFSLICIPNLVSGFAAPTFLGPLWIAALALLAAALQRALVSGPGLARTRGALAIPRSSTPAAADTEGPRQWAWELAGTVGAVVLGAQTLLTIAVSGASAGTDELQPEGAAAIIILGILLGVWALGALAATILGARRATRAEALLTINATLHQELRSELLLLARFRAQGRW